MATTRERLHEMLDALPDDRLDDVEAAIADAAALLRGRTVVSACDLPTADVAESDPALMGYGLARYCVLKGWTRGELADWFGIVPDTLAALYAEPRPKADGGFMFRGLVQGIAGRYMLDDTTKLYEAHHAGLEALADDARG